jgi:hypothetical protein
MIRRGLVRMLGSPIPEYLMLGPVILGSIILGSLILAGCTIQEVAPDFTPPAMPRGVITSAGNNVIDVYWEPVPDYDLAQYRVYVSDRYNGRYDLIGTTSGTYFPDYGAANGLTYFYAVSAVDYSGNESALSMDEAVAVARPEAYGVQVYNARVNPSLGGFAFATAQVLPWDMVATDIYFDYDQGVPYMVAYGDIVDMGPTRDLRDVSFAPEGGWAPAREVILRRGYTYVVWTEDNNYAKVRVTEISANRVVFDCAYQLQQGNPLLKRDTGRSERIHALRTR